MSQFLLLYFSFLIEWLPYSPKMPLGSFKSYFHSYFYHSLIKVQFSSFLKLLFYVFMYLKYMLSSFKNWIDVWKTESQTEPSCLLVDSANAYKSLGLAGSKPGANTMQASCVSNRDLPTSTVTAAFHLTMLLRLAAF